MKRTLTGLAAVFCLLLWMSPPPAKAAPGGPPRCMWLGNFGDIQLPAVTSRGATVVGSSTCILRTNSDAEITADNSTAARLEGPGGDYLPTEYTLRIEGQEVEPFTPYDSFLQTPGQVDYSGGLSGPWMDAEICLRVRAISPSDRAVNAGQYSAVQTLTAHW